MLRSPAFAFPLAVLVLSNPAWASPRGAIAPLSFRLQSGNARHRTADQDRLPFLATFGAAVPQADTRPLLPASPFRARLLAKGRPPKVSSVAASWGDGAVVLDTWRAKSPPREEGELGYMRERFSTAQVDFGLTQDIGPDDSVAMSASFGLERRRPSFFVGGRNIYKSQSRSITAAWTHDDRLRLSASAFKLRPSGTRSEIERLVELAGGASPALHGYSLAAELLPERAGSRLSLGLEVRRQTLTDGDAFGAASGRADSRLLFTLRRAF